MNTNELTDDMKLLLRAAYRVAPAGQAFALEDLPLSLSNLARQDCAFVLSREPLRYLARRAAGSTSEGTEILDPRGNLYALTKLGRPIARQLNVDSNKELEAPEPNHKSSLPEAVEVCREAISTYRISRQQLVGTYAELNRTSGTWQPKCERGLGAGAVHVRVGALDIRPDGKISGSGIVRDNEPYAPFHDFRLLDSSKNPAPPETPAFAIQQKMAYFMSEIRKSALALSGLLPQLAMLAPNFAIDPKPLTQLRHRLAPFPYVPVRERTLSAHFQLCEESLVEGLATVKTDQSPDFTPASREKALADDEPFFAEAMVTLDHLVQAYWRGEQKLAQSSERQAHMGTPPDADSLLDRIERAKSTSPLHKALYGISLVVVVLIVVFLFVGNWQWALIGGLSLIAATILWNAVASPRSHHANLTKWFVVIAFGIVLAMLLVKLGYVLFEGGPR